MSLMIRSVVSPDSTIADKAKAPIDGILSELATRKEWRAVPENPLSQCVVQRSAKPLQFVIAHVAEKCSDNKRESQENEQ